ncbi:MAG: L,D-transpeptidase family protein [Lachnospiraceae bacterium]|nr:L,D-transpeptidase family protein [Lachnospiraceae bacterium]
MALNRKQRRWLREHRALVNWIKFFIFLLVVGGIWFGLAKWNEKFTPKSIYHMAVDYFSGKDITGETDPVETEPVTEASTEPVYISNVIEFQEEVDEEYQALLETALAFEPDPEDKKPYQIKVNRILNCVTVYGKDENGFYNVPVKAFVCSTGKDDDDNRTPLGSGSITDVYEFHPMVDGTYAQYATRFMAGGILFHSVPYYTKSKDDLETDQFNKLGDFASLGCVRMCVRDALWVQENCPEGTAVIVYDDATTPGPLGKPEMIKLPEESQYAGWDPTDPDPENPWNAYDPELSGVVDITIFVGETADVLSGVKATDTCGNDITDRIVVTGSYDNGIPGEYEITYTVKDGLDSVYLGVDSSATKTAKIVVVPRNSQEVGATTSGTNTAATTTAATADATIETTGATTAATTEATKATDAATETVSQGARP